MKPRAPIPLNASRLLIGLGLLLLVSAAAMGRLDRPPAAAPFDLGEDSPQGFEPIRLPQGSPDQLAAAPALPSHLPPTLAPLMATVSAMATGPTPTGVAPTRVAVGPATPVGPLPSATPAPLWIPDRLVIPAIGLVAPVLPAALTEVMSGGQLYQQWLAPDEQAAGWHTTSATLGLIGNTVLNGHHNVHGEVFGHLVDLRADDLVWVYSGPLAFVYQIRLITILPERWQPLETRLVNARWIQSSSDERLTLVTCWPYTSNTHRLIIVAARVDLSALAAVPLIPRLTPRAP